MASVAFPENGICPWAARHLTAIFGPQTLAVEAVMAVRKLDRTEWRSFCDRVSKGLHGQRAEIQISSPSLGSQVEASWLPFLGIVYEHKSDMIEIALEGLDHMIRHPQELHADDGPLGLATLEIIDGDGARQILRLRDPLLLPAPEGSDRSREGPQQ
jgi:hypothetical protein